MVERDQQRQQITAKNEVKKEEKKLTHPLTRSLTYLQV